MSNQTGIQRRRRTQVSIRADDQRANDLSVIAALHLRGKSAAEISRFLSEARPYAVSPASVTNDMALIRKEWLNSALIDFNEAKARELARIDALEQSAWDAWEQSWQPATEQSEEEYEEDVLPSLETLLEGNGGPIRLKKLVKRARKADRIGSKAFLDVVQWCIEQRCKIYGFNSPKQIEVTWRAELEKLGLRPDDIIEGLARDIESQVLENTNGTGIS